jgi:hypothetical protein
MHEYRATTNPRPIWTVKKFTVGNNLYLFVLAFLPSHGQSFPTKIEDRTSLHVFHIPGDSLLVEIPGVRVNTGPSCAVR